MTGPELSAWLQRHSKLVLVVFVLILFALLAFFAYDKHQRAQAAHAAVLFNELQMSLASGQTATARASAETLVHDYGELAYGKMAHFYLAQLDLDDHNFPGAEAQLRFLSQDRTLPTGMQAMAQIRLARLYLEQKKPQLALNVLPHKDPAFAVLAWELRGDAELALQHLDLSRQDYEKALAALPVQDPYRAFLQLKIANLGVTE